MRMLGPKGYPNRRRFLKLLGGYTGLATLAPFADSLFSPRRARAATTPPFMIVVYCDGGWDQTLVFDPKLGVPNVAQETGTTVATTPIAYADNPSRPSVKAFFNTYGTKSVIINGLSVGAMDHGKAQGYMLGATDQNHRECDWLSFYADSSGGAWPLPHVVFDAPYLPGARAHQAVFLDDALITSYTAQAASLGSNAETAIDTYLRWSYTHAFDGRALVGSDAEKLRAFTDGRSHDSLLHDQLTSALANIGNDPSASPFLRHGRLAVDLFKRGQSLCATIRCGGPGAWDTHKNNFTTQSALFENLFSDLGQILSAATTAGIADNLCLVVMSELGRAPYLNAAAGKDHWPYNSALVVGPGVKGGSVVGTTDQSLRGQPMDPIFGDSASPRAVPITMAHVFGALYLKYGVNSAPLLTAQQCLALMLAEVA